MGSSGIRSLQGRNRWFKGTDRWLRALLLSPFVPQRLRFLIHADSKEDLALLAQLIEAGKIAPVVDRTFDLEAAAEAIRYTESGRARGKVVVATGSQDGAP